MKRDKIGTTAYNRPHQQMIHYSAKGYDEYRADLIKRLTDRGFVLREDDFLNAFIDLTAYLGEVLMTYQNAYAHEIYLETAQLRESLFNLAAMIDYRIDPGAAATGRVVVMAKPNRSGLLPKGSPISGKEEGAKRPVFFETDTDLNVDARFNDFTLAETERFNDIVIDNSLTVTEMVVVKTGQYLYFHQETPTADLFTQVESAIDNEEKKTTILQWKRTSVYKRPSDATLTMGSGRWAIVSAEEKGLLKLSGSDLWLDRRYEKISVNESLILKKRGVTDRYGIIKGVRSELVTVRTGVIRWISQDPADSSAGEREEYHYTIKVQEDGSTVYKTFYALERDITQVSEVTRLEIDWIDSSSGDYIPAVMERSKEHFIYAGIHKRLSVQTREEDKTVLAGEPSLTVDGDFRGLEKYRTLILHEVINGAKTVEEVSIVEVIPNGSQSILRLKDAISNSFTRHGVRIWGNVVRVTQGKRVADAIIGSGRGDESYQSLELPQSPLTYERKGREGVRAAIDIRVSDLPWQQRDDFLKSGQEDRHYIIETDFDNKSRVVFGDGINGSRLPTGRDNIIASFRIGQGSSGNISPGVLKKPVSRPSFLKELFNPIKSGGGSDPDKEEELREKIPAEHLTFDRAVSLQDYADIALSYPGIAKARAGWRWLNNKEYVYLAVAVKEEGDISLILEDLRNHLDARRDVNQPLIVKEVDIVLIGLSIEVTASSDYTREGVKDAIYKALGRGVNDDGTPQFFNFDRLAIGMSIHKKDIYRSVEAIPGVETITDLKIKRVAPPASTGYYIPSLCPDDIWINNWELARLDTATLDITVIQSPIDRIACPIKGNGIHLREFFKN